MKIKLFFAITAILLTLVAIIIFVKPPERRFTLDSEDVDNPNIPRIQKAAEEGNAEAQFAYGHCLLTGNNIPENKPEGVKWLQKSADQGFAIAQSELGSCYYYGEGIAQDKEKGIALIKQGVQNGFTKAQRWLDVIEEKENNN